FVALLVSGGHTQLMRVESVGRYELLGETIDDAAGEAFDKSAKLLGLGYPGGPAVAALAARGREGAVSLPRPMLHSGDLDFSFSGLKTAVLTAVRRGLADEQARADLAFAVQAAIVDVLVAKSLAALRHTGLRQLVIAGGVSANQRLRAALARASDEQRVSVFFPEPALCTDNGAMIAFAAALRLQAAAVAQPGGGYGGAFSVRPRWPLEELEAPTALAG
ncbi:MAG: tRNA (adenosine(37)-N6)-threonylcarbamoyltransferase complex transferase subunit TsaD, partial [Betaproteobacteria bacterium]|nr:tRNA (adenosine(37)-N6)-threonylcarbamoyltransferase complex transferase subunit TsaD [Betaproteobacteria bacterium]